MIVVDASVVVAALGDDGVSGNIARSRLRGEDLLAPHLIDVEVQSALRRLTSAGMLPVERARQAIDDLVALRVERAPHGALLARCWELRENVTTYDAIYVALAEAADVVLVTADRRLAVAPGPQCAIEVLSVA